MQANFDEARQSQLPAIELLINMGYVYLPCAEVQRLRGDDNSKFLLKEIAFESLKRINHFEHKEQKYPFSDKNILDAIDELGNIPLNGLQDTAKEVYHMIMTNGGKTIREMVDGKMVSQNFRFIDFENPENNLFHVVAEFPIDGKIENIRPDIVCFVNGIPFVVIENKKSGTAVTDALTQMNRNQRPEYCTKFFVYPQLLIGTNVEECSYGTTGTPNKFYAKWKEKELDKEMLEKNIQALIQKNIPNERYQTICADLNGATLHHKQMTDRLTTAQDKGLYGLARPERLLSLTKHFILFDEGIKKVARYQQYFAIHKMLERVKQEIPGKEGLRREGGIVWHTQGSGKSLTMVLFVKALIENPHLINSRVIIVTDRVDLDRQIANTFRNCNLKKEIIQSRTGKHLLDFIKEKNSGVITSLVHKFDTAAKSKADFLDLDKNIFVLIDEAHRTQNGLASEEMRRIIPNACFIGFTGTPLLKKEKSQNRFGTFIDKYTIDDALADEIILPLIYEGRYTEMNQNKEKVDRHIERITKDLDAQSVKELQKFINSKVIKNNPHRITEIAYDIEDHFRSYFQGTGLKAQLVAPSKYSALLFHKLFEEGGRLKTAVVISGENYEEDENDRKKEVVEFLKEKSLNYANLENYEKEVIESFKHDPEGIEILIVVHKLLTGFDAPRNTILYLSKDLKDHNLLQAIARVNRLFENKDKPKTAGFIIDYSENAQNIKSAMELFGNYDEEDVRSTLIDTGQKISDLEQSYAVLEDEFKAVKNQKDSESYLEFLGEEKSGEQRRSQFYKNFNKFLKNLDECMCLHDFSTKFEHLDAYKKELKRYAELRKSAQLKFADKKDLSEYKFQLVKILDKYVDAEQVELLTEPININDSEAFTKALESLGTPKSKAEAIAAQTERTITEKAETDPEFYRRFSEKIQEILKKMREGKLADIEALRALQIIKNQVINKEDDQLPAMLKSSKGADIFYRNLKNEFMPFGISENDFCKIILDIFTILKAGIIIDWHRQPDTQRIIKNKIDDYLYDEVKINMNINLSHEDLAQILDKILNLALENHELF